MGTDTKSILPTVAQCFLVDSQSAQESWKF